MEPCSIGSTAFREGNMDVRLSAINVYPVKGIRGEPVSGGLVEPAGLRGDRRWILADAQGIFLSQRSFPRLALLSGTFDGTTLKLSGPDLEPMTIPVPDGSSRMRVRVWRDDVDAAAVAPETDRLLSTWLGHPCHLAYMDDGCRRPITSAAGRPSEVVSFADGYPLLLISESSLEDLNAHLDVPLPMDRFRPNLVVAGCAAFAEDQWRRIAIGDTVFRHAGLCARCSVTTVDQATGTRVGEEPLRTLAKYRQTEEGVVFGVNLVPEKTGAITVGDRITILE